MKITAWHYTTGTKFPAIVASGLLLPAHIAVAFPEKPILWFSLNAYWEPTACKAVIENGSIRRLTMRETFELGGGLVRFGCDLRRLTGGESLRKKARMSREAWNALVKEGKCQGATVSDWFGAVGPVPIDGLAIEVMSQAMKWERISTTAARTDSGQIGKPGRCFSQATLTTTQHRRLHHG